MIRYKQEEILESDFVPRFNESHPTLLPIIIRPSSGFLPQVDYHAARVTDIDHFVCEIDFPAMSVSKLMATPN